VIRILYQKPTTVASRHTNPFEAPIRPLVEGFDHSILSRVFDTEFVKCKSEISFAYVYIARSHNQFTTANCFYILRKCILFEFIQYRFNTYSSGYNAIEGRSSMFQRSVRFGV
jgi:hypothetical protein